MESDTSTNIPSPNPLPEGEGARFVGDLSRLIGSDSRLGLAVSGGPDSMALLTLAAGALPGRIVAATVDHGLRTGSADEAAMVARHCAAIGVPHLTLRAEPIEGASLQAQARAARYALLAGWATQAGVDAIATAHHADDQAETFLMRASRASGVGGLAGVRPVATIAGMRVVRPLLGWRRAELRAIVRRARVPFVDDPANADPRHDRTRFRALLDANEWLDPPALARAAAQAAEADDALAALAELLWGERAAGPAGDLRVTVTGLPREMRRRLARRAIAAVRDAAAIRAPDFAAHANIEPLLDRLADGRRATHAGILASVAGDGEIWRFRPAPPRRLL